MSGREAAQWQSGPARAARHPGKLGEPEVAAFLSHLAVARRVAPNTRAQAMNALVFLYRHVPGRPLGDIPGIVRARKKQRVPVVPTAEEVARLLAALEGVHWLIACLLYGSGLRLMEAMRLRVEDLELEHGARVVRDGKGRKDRVVTLPAELVVPLRRHLQARRTEHASPLGCALSRAPTAEPAAGQGDARRARRPEAGR